MKNYKWNQYNNNKKLIKNLIDFNKKKEVNAIEKGLYNQIRDIFCLSLILSLKVSKKNKLLIWGNGKAKREAIHVDDLANACVFFMNKKTKHSIINIGTGKDYSIKYYADLIKKIILPNKKIFFQYDLTKPNGTPRKVMNVSVAKKYGWKFQTSLKESILNTYHSYLKEIK